MTAMQPTMLWHCQPCTATGSQLTCMFCACRRTDTCEVTSKPDTGAANVELCKPAGIQPITWTKPPHGNDLKAANRAEIMARWLVENDIFYQRNLSSIQAVFNKAKQRYETAWIAKKRRDKRRAQKQFVDALFM